MHIKEELTNINEELVKNVNKIIQTNIDRREGYEKALEQVEDTALKSLFTDCCKQSNEYINELRQIVIQHDGTPVDVTSTAGDLFRAWMDVKKALALNNTKAVLQSCEKGEDVALNAYIEITKAGNGTNNEMVMSVLGRQRDGILTMHNRVKELRDKQ